jgi:Tfp pilus assembly PilM family ATPase
MLNSIRPQRAVVIDFGASSTKAIYIERHDEELQLLNYLVQPPLTAETRDSLPLLADRLRNIHQELGAKSKQVYVALSPVEGVFRNVELPQVPVADLRHLLKNNAKQYLHQELTGHEVDCTIVSRAPATSVTSLSSEGMAGGRPQIRQNVLLGAASQTLVDQFENAAIAAGLVMAEVTFTQSGLINCVRQTSPQLLADNAVALIDIGLRSTCITIFLNSNASLTRVIPIGGQHLTAGLAKEFGIAPDMAEELKVTMSDKDFSKLEKLSRPLLDELRASIDFFEQLHERIVSHALITGGAARGEATIRLLQEGLVVPRCQMWDLAEGITLALEGEKPNTFAKDASRLGGVLGLAKTILLGEERRINLLAERQEAEDLRRRDPVKRSLQLGGALVSFRVLWGLLVQWQIQWAKRELVHVEAELVTVRQQAAAVTALAQKAVSIDRQRLRLNRQAADRFLWTGPLNALQYSVVDGVEVVRLQLDQTLTTMPAIKPVTNALDRVTPGKPASVVHKVSLLISARDSGEPPEAEKFIEALAAQAYFKERLRAEDPVLLRERLPQQLDPVDGTNKFIPFSIECVFKEWRTFDE